MNDTAIYLEGLGKQYRIGSRQERYRTLRDSLVGAAAAPFRRVGRLLRGQAGGGANPDETIWALKDVSLRIRPGETVGIIGRNGAGKSTLLKILSRITEPTEGHADIYGRVGSLLEVGTGFHPELTGRENIALNGAILGMRRREIARKFDEIVAFAEVERFIDTPVKHYSSGMYLRLAFAVAAHLEPEILLVDEVLAVGDAAFQKKCLGKMGDVAKEGRTVLFVSHSMSAILNLCRTACWLDVGRVRQYGAAAEVVQSYLSEGVAGQERDLTRHPGRRKGKHILLQSVRLSEDGTPTATFRTAGAFEFAVECAADPQLFPHLSLGFAIRDSMETILFANSMTQYTPPAANTTGRCVFRVRIDRLPLNPGTYSLSLYAGNGVYDADIIDGAILFEVLWNTDLDHLLYPPPAYWGPLHIPLVWDFATIESRSGASATPEPTDGRAVL